LDGLDDELGSGEIWGGATMETLVAFGFMSASHAERRERAPAGAHRLAAFAALKILLLKLTQPRWPPEKVQEARERLGVTELDYEAIIRDRVLDVAAENGFSAAELAETSKAVSGIFKRWRPADSG